LPSGTGRTPPIFIRSAAMRASAMRFPPFEHLHFYEGLHGAYVNISLSNMEPFPLRGFGRSLPRDLDLNWVPPDGPPELRKLLGKLHGLPADHVILTSGATEGNFLVNAALVKPGDRVVVDAPMYSPLRDCPVGFGAEVVPVARDCKDGWALDLDRVRKAMGRRCRLVVFCNLGNPTSAAISNGELRELADLAEDRGAYVLVDETFRELAFRKAPPSAAAFGPRMVALSTVSKREGLGGLRTGWMVADPGFLDRVRGIKDYTTVGGSSVAYEVAAWTLRRHSFFVRRAKRILDVNRRIARDALERMPALHGGVPDIGNVLFPHSDVDVARLERLLLRKYRTVIAHGRFFGQGMDKHFRIGIGGKTSELRRGLANLGRALAELT